MDQLATPVAGRPDATPPSRASAAPAAGGENRSLTGLRGVAAAYVVLQHLLYVRDATGAAAQRLLSKGYLTVDVFFVLSGLVMAMTYQAMFANPYRMADHLGFMLKRAARILPLYLCVLALTCAALALQGRPPGAAQTAGNLVLAQAWGLGIVPVVAPSWSISTEAVAYALFPALCLAALHKGRAWWAACLVAAALCVGTAPFAVTPGARALAHGALDVWDGASFGPLLRCLGGFTAGLLLFRLARLPLACRLAAADGFGLAVLALLTAEVALDVGDLVLYPLLPAGVLALNVNRDRIAAVMGAALPHRLGVLSYAVYLVHALVIALLWPASRAWLADLSTRTRGVASAAICLGVVWALAALLHATFEKPGRAWIRCWRRAAPWQPGKQTAF